MMDSETRQTLLCTFAAAALLIVGCKSSELTREGALKLLQRNESQLGIGNDITDRIPLREVTGPGPANAQQQGRINARDELVKLGILTKEPMKYLGMAEDCPAYRCQETADKPPRVQFTIFNYGVVPAEDIRFPPKRGDPDAAEVIAFHHHFKEITGIKSSGKSATVNVKSAQQPTKIYNRIREATGNILLNPYTGTMTQTEHTCRFALYDDGWRVEGCSE